MGCRVLLGGRLPLLSRRGEAAAAIMTEKQECRLDRRELMTMMRGTNYMELAASRGVGRVGFETVASRAKHSRH